MAYLCLQATREGQASHAHVHEIIGGLQSRGWAVSLFEPWYAASDSPPTLWQRIYGFFTVQVRLWRRLGEFDVVYVRSHFASLPSCILLRLLHVPTVQELNGPPSDLFAAYPWTRRLGQVFPILGNLCLRMADCVITVTPQLREWVLSKYPKQRVFVVPNGANTAVFQPGVAPYIVLPPVYVVFFGALASWQGIDTLLDAVHSDKWPKEVSLVVMGDGQRRERIEAAAARSTRILYLGKVPYRKISSIVGNSLAGLIPKINTPERRATGLSPLKLFETLACGVPAVVSDLPWLSDFVTLNRCGIVIASGDAHSLAAAVAQLHADRNGAKKMGKRGREAILREHSWDHRAGETERVLLSAISGKAFAKS